MAQGLGVGRDLTVDTLRGMAIFTMVAANLAGPVLVEPHPFSLRVYGTFAAPCFVLLGGMMLGHPAGREHHGFGHYLTRGALLLVVAALIDVFVFGCWPFVYFDVLNLIGFSLPVCWLFLPLPPWTRWLSVALLFAGAPILQSRFGYVDTPVSIELSSETGLTTAHLPVMLRQWLLDGYFPVFPWLGFALLGVLFADLRWGDAPKLAAGGAGPLAAGLGLMALALPAWWLWPAVLLTREGYSELFYPPTPTYLSFAVGLILCLFWLVDRTQPWRAWRPLQALGESSLFMYVTHLALISHVVRPRWPRCELGPFGVIYVVLIVSLIALAYGLRHVKARWKGKPFLVRFLLGG